MTALFEETDGPEADLRLDRRRRAHVQIGTCVSTARASTSGNHAGAVYLPRTHNGSNCPAIRFSFGASRGLRRCNYACVVRMAAGSWRESRHRPSAGLHKPIAVRCCRQSSWFSHDDVGWTNPVQLTNRPRRRAAWTSRSTCRGPADRGSARPVSGRCRARCRRAAGRGQPRSRTASSAASDVGHYGGDDHRRRRVYRVAFGTIVPQAYLPISVMLFSLIVRGVSVEMLSPVENRPRG
jgi:hypothetical protein